MALMSATRLVGGRLVWTDPLVSEGDKRRSRNRIAGWVSDTVGSSGFQPLGVPEARKESELADWPNLGGFCLSGCFSLPQ